MAMQTWADRQQDMLRTRHPGFDVWYVSNFPLIGYTWCARPKGSPVATINADSPDELSAAIRRGQG